MTVDLQGSRESLKRNCFSFITVMTLFSSLINTAIGQGGGGALGGGAGGSSCPTYTWSSPKGDKNITLREAWGLNRGTHCTWNTESPDAGLLICDASKETQNKLNEAESNSAELALLGIVAVVAVFFLVACSCVWHKCRENNGNILTHSEGASIASRTENQSGLGV